MIKGLTHDIETGIPNKVTKFKGKISTGFAPGEGPNKSNYPTAAGFFRLLKQVTKTQRVGGKDVAIVKWVENDPIQKALSDTIESKTPRKLDFISMYKTPSEIWESYLGKYSNVDGLVCKSMGEGSIPTELIVTGDIRERKPRLFDGKAECPYKECPDFKANKCCERGFMKVFPLVDMSTQPYQFTTTSINTILAIESSLDDMYNIARAAHLIRIRETGKEVPFEGLFGVNMSLIHKKISSGGRKVFITELAPSPEFSASMMSVIQRGIGYKSQSYLEGGEDNIGLIENVVGENLLIESAIDEMSVQDEIDVANDFPKGTVDSIEKSKNDKEIESKVTEAMTD